MSTFGNLRSFAGSSLDSLHSDHVRDLEASHSRICKHTMVIADLFRVVLTSVTLIFLFFFFELLIEICMSLVTSLLLSCQDSTP